MVINHEKRSGFTLAELLVAVGISVLIVVMLGTMFGSLTNTAAQTNQRIDAFREARAALQVIERDLKGLVHTPSSAYFVLTNQTYSDPASNKSGQIFAVCTVKNQPSGAPTPAPGDVCAVGYYCRWETDPNGKQGRYVLRRYFHDSAATLAIFKANAGKYVSPIALYLPGSGDDLLATYVWNLQVTAYKTDGTVDATFPMEVGSPGITLPAAVEVSFTAMSTSAAKTMMSVSSSPDDWMNSNSSNYKRLIAPHAYQFRTRINLP